MSSDSRQHPRKHVSLLLKLKHESIERFVEEWATNVSATGMFVRSKTPPAVGTQVGFEVRLARDIPVLKGTALVRWTRAPGDPAGPAGMGLEFTSLEEAARRLIHRMVAVNELLQRNAAPVPPATPAPRTGPKPPAPVPARPPPASPAELAPPKPRPVSASKPLVANTSSLLELDDEPLFPPPTPPDHVDASLDELKSLLADLTLENGPTDEADDPLALAFSQPAPARATKASPPPPKAPAPPKAEEVDPFAQLEDIPVTLDDPDEGPHQKGGGSRELDLEGDAPVPHAPQGKSIPSTKATPPAPAKPIRAGTHTAYLTDAGPLRSEGPVVGIDLGTSNSCVAALVNGKATVLRTRDGHSTLPSVISLATTGKLLIGHRAKGQQLLNPNQTIYGAKRLVGREYESAVVREVKERFLYDICADEAARAAVKLGPHVVSLEEVQAIILRECKELAEGHLSQPIHRAVVTVPAYYSEPQRDAVRRAGALAGLKVERVLNEPTAAALAYGMNRKLQRRVLIYDLGGGTFDATVLKVENNTFEVLATGGDTFLGGTDFDNAIVDILLERFEETSKIRFNGDRVALSRVTDAAERAKVSLSDRQDIPVDVPMLMMDAQGKPHSLQVTLRRTEVEQRVTPLIERTIESLRDVLLDANLKPSDVDDIILVGGQSRMPLVRERIAQFFKKPPHAGVNADEAVALGAALFAGTVDKASSVVLIDVLPVTIGIGLPGGKFERVLLRNTALPAQATVTVTTTEPAQRMLEVFLFQGEAKHVSANEYLGTAKIFGVPGTRKGTPVKLTLRLSPDCQLSVEAHDAAGAALKTKVEMEVSKDALQKKLEVSREAALEAETSGTTELRSRAGRFWSFLQSKLGGGKR